MKDERKEFVDAAVDEKLEKVTDALKTVVEGQEKLIKEQGEKIEALSKTVTDRIVVSDNKDEGKCGFENHGDFLKMVRAGINSAGFKAYQTKAAGDPTLQGAVLTDGGYIRYPAAYSTMLMDQALESADFFGKCTNIPVPGKTAEIPYIAGKDESGGTYYGGIKFYWTKELEQLTSTKPQFGKMEMKLHNLTGLCYDSADIEEDSPISSMIPVMFPRAMAQSLDESFIHGTGVDQPQGIMNAGAAVTIAKEGSQVADTIYSENIDKMVARGFRGGAGLSWVINPDCYPQIVSMVRVIKNVAGAENVGGVPSLLYDANTDKLAGRPIIWSDHAMTVGDLGDIMLVDFSQYITITKAANAMKMDMSIHIKFDYNQNCWRFVYRIDGQCGWYAAKTPRRSANTRSPIVMLAARA